jgi:hypothetical protein
MGPLLRMAQKAMDPTAVDVLGCTKTIEAIVLF